MNEVNRHPDVYLFVVDGYLRDRYNRKVNKHQSQPVQYDFLHAMKEEVKLWVANELPLFFINTENKGKCQDDETSDDHVIQGFEILDLKH